MNLGPGRRLDSAWKFIMYTVIHVGVCDVLLSVGQICDRIMRESVVVRVLMYLSMME